MSSASPAFVAVIESAYQLDLLLSGLHNGEAPLIVAMTAEADYACERCGGPYTTIEDYYSEQELYRESRANRQRLETICEIIDDNCARFQPAGPDTALFSARSYRYHLRLLLDSLLSRTYQLTSLLQTVKPEHLLYFQREAGQVPDDLLFSNESLCARIIPVLADCFSVIPLRVFDPRPVSVLAPHQPPETAPMFDLSKPLLLLANFWMNREVLPEFCSSGGQVVGLDDLLGGLVSYRSVPQLLEENFEALFQALQADPALKKLFVWGDIDLYPVILDRIRHFIQSVMPRHIRAAQRVASFLRTAPHSVVMGNSPVRLADAACFAAARHCKVPTVVYQHGIFGNNTDYEQTDTALSDYIFCFGAGEVAFAEHMLTRYDRYGTQLTAKPLAVGSSQYDSLFNHYHNSSWQRKADQTNPLQVIYALGTIVGETRTFDCKMIPDIAYWRLEQSVVEICCRFPDVHLFVKCFPAGADGHHNPLTDWVRDRNFSNCTLIDDMPFTALLEIADLVITDIPSSVMIETITTEIPLVVLVNESYYPEPYSWEFMELLRRRATVATSRASFLDAISTILSGGRSTLPSLTDDEFLITYGIFLKDGQSAVRASSALHQIIKNPLLPNPGENMTVDTFQNESAAVTERKDCMTCQTSSGILQLWCPNDLCAWRAETLLTKEPETIEWIETFAENSIFWDIGANVGLYSLYAALRGVNVLAFEPSAFNYYVLNRNIEANKLDNRILAFCIAFSDQSVLDHFCLATTETGGAMNSFGAALDFEGKPYIPAFRQGMLGYNVDEFMRRFNPPFPNHIKIDVDGLENKIIRGAENVLKDLRLQSLLIELEEDRTDLTDEVIGALARAGLQLVAKRHAPMFDSSPFSQCYNYIFMRN